MLDKNLVAEILNEALSTGGDYAEIFVENILANSLFTSNGKIKNSSSGLSYGAGIRIFDGVNFVYAYTNLMDRENLLKTAKKAALGIKSSKKDITFDLRDLELERKHQILKPFNTKSKKEKADLMFKISEYALNPLTISGNVYELWQDIELIGNDIKFIPNGCGSPTIAVKPMQISCN